MNAEQVWIKPVDHPVLCELLFVTSKSQGLLHPINRTWSEALLSSDGHVIFPTLCWPWVCIILKDSEQYVIIIIPRHRKTARQTLTVPPSCSEPFLIVLYLSFKIDLHFALTAKGTHSSPINIVSTPHLQTGTFYDSFQLLELSEKKLQFRTNTGFLISLSSLGPGSIFRGQKKTLKGAHVSLFMTAFLVHLCFFLGGNSTGGTTSVADLTSG